VATRVGYCGGSKQHPTYHALGDHAETIEIDFDADAISYAQVLDLFWEQHAPVRAPWKRQYMSAIYVANDAQRAIAEQSKAARERATKRTMYTEIAPLPETRFWRAEDYHQKYALRHDRLFMKELGAVYDERAFEDSTVAARLNGFVSGDGDPALLDREIDRYGLSPDARRHLRAIVGGAKRW
jgi:peptide-methionine (S)-S-oxide reductase